MLTFQASCICNSEALRGANSDNVLFSGQILPEANGGLAGVPTAKFTQDPPFAAAVLDGCGSAGAKAACFAAGAFRGVADKLHSEQDLAALLTELHGEFSSKAPADTGISAVGILVSGDRLYLSNYGSCRAYLVRDRALYILSRQESGSAFLGAVGVAAKPYALSGSLKPGDQLLLCSDGLHTVLNDTTVLQVLCSGSGTAAALQTLQQKAAARGTADTVTAILLRFDAEI